MSYLTETTDIDRVDGKSCVDGHSVERSDWIGLRAGCELNLEQVWPPVHMCMYNGLTVFRHFVIVVTSDLTY